MNYALPTFVIAVSDDHPKSDSRQYGQFDWADTKHAKHASLWIAEREGSSHPRFYPGQGGRCEYGGAG